MSLLSPSILLGFTCQIFVICSISVRVLFSCVRSSILLQRFDFYAKVWVFSAKKQVFHQFALCRLLPFRLISLFSSLPWRFGPDNSRKTFTGERRIFFFFCDLEVHDQTRMQLLGLDFVMCVCFSINIFENEESIVVLNAPFEVNVWSYFLNGLLLFPFLFFSISLNGM